ncbi:MAG: ABC transporter permease [Oscillospiraceae bacterium]|nr:ABC transporter permease [Oscillospiraceae bacterium]
MFFKDLYRYRHLLREIVVKNIKIQYRHSVLGVVWTLLEPLLTTLVLVFVFGRLFGGGRIAQDPNIINFPIYLLCGRLLFDFFSKSTKRAMKSMKSSASVIKKVRVPKFIYPVANVLSNFVTFMISMIVLVGFVVFFVFAASERNPAPILTWNLLLAPVPLIILFILSTGVGLIVSTLAVFFKDVEYLYSVFCLTLFYATPIFWSPATMGGTPDSGLMMVLNVNPLFAIIEMFRDTVLRGQMIQLRQFVFALVFALAVFVFGTWLFQRKQNEFILHI